MPPAVAGNHVVLGLGPTGPYVLLAHLRRGTVRVAPGDELDLGAPVGECGNSGNSTEPHVHLQVTDSVAWETAVGLPIAFRRPCRQPAEPGCRPRPRSSTPADPRSGWARRDGNGGRGDGR